jgi:hypothetical protein
MYQLFVCIDVSGSAYHGTATVINDGANTSILNNASGAGMTISLSGATIRVAQNTGANQFVEYRLVKIR